MPDRSNKMPGDQFFQRDTLPTTPWSKTFQRIDDPSGMEQATEKVGPGAKRLVVDVFGSHAAVVPSSALLLLYTRVAGKQVQVMQLSLAVGDQVGESFAHQPGAAFVMSAHFEIPVPWYCFKAKVRIYGATDWSASMMVFDA